MSRVEAYLAAANCAADLMSDPAVAARWEEPSALSVRRHGSVAVLRSLSRAERAPASISAF